MQFQGKEIITDPLADANEETKAKGVPFGELFGLSPAREKKLHALLHKHIAESFEADGSLSSSRLLTQLPFFTDDAQELAYMSFQLGTHFVQLRDAQAKREVIKDSARTFIDRLVPANPFAEQPDGEPGGDFGSHITRMFERMAKKHGAGFRSHKFEGPQGLEDMLNQLRRDLGHDEAADDHDAANEQQ